MARMLSNSMLRFLVIYTNTLFAFSLGATLLTQNVFSKPLDPDYDDEDERGVRSRLAEIPSTWFEMIKLFIWVSTGEVVPPGRMLTEARNPALMTVLYLCFLVVSTWMLMNLLISLMGDTFRSDFVLTFHILHFNTLCWMLMNLLTWLNLLRSWPTHLGHLPRTSKRASKPGMQKPKPRAVRPKP